MSDRRFSPSTLAALLAAVYLIVIAAMISYPINLWGITHLQYVGWWERLAILFAGIGLSFLLITIDHNTKLPKRLKRLLVYVIAPLSLLVLFYVLQVKTQYLGDGVLRARQVEIGVKLLPTEPLGYYADYLAYQLAGPLFHLKSVQAIQMLSYASGLFAYFAALYLVAVLFKKEERRAFPFTIIFFSGVTLLYCGYVETYSLLPALIMLFMATGIRAVNGKLSPLIPAALYLLLVLFHFKFLYLAPSVLMLAYQYYKNGRRLDAISCVSALAASLAGVVIIPAMASIPTMGLGSFLMDFTAGHSSYWLFCGQHLLDIVNELLLTSVAAVIMIAAFAFTGNLKGYLQQRSLMFVGASLPGAIGFLVLLHPELGYASDWDLFSSAGVVICLFAVTLYSVRAEFRLRRVTQTLLSATAIISFLSYAAVNSSWDKAIARQIDILTVAGDQGAIGFEAMGNDLKFAGNNQLAEQMWKRSLRIRPHWRIYSNLAQLSLNRGNYDEAEYYLKKGMALDSTRFIFAMNLGMAYRMKGRLDLGEKYLRQARMMAPNEAGVCHNLAMCLAEEGKYAEAEVESRQALQLIPDDVMFINGLAAILTSLGKYQESESYLFQALSLRPNDPESTVNLSQLYVTMKDSDAARKVLVDYLTRLPNGEGTSRVRKQLDDLNKQQ